MSARPIVCHACRHSWTYQAPLERRAECSKCHRDAHVCLNCVFYDTGAHHECREEQAEWVKEKDRANFCSYFSARTSTAQVSEAEKALSKLQSLFGGNNAVSSAKASGVKEELARFLAAKK